MGEYLEPWCDCPPEAEHSHICVMTPIYTAALGALVTIGYDGLMEYWPLNWGQTQLRSFCTRCGRAFGEINGPEHYCLRDHMAVG